MFISFDISITQSLQHLFYWDNLNDRNLGCKRTTKERWFFTVPLCVKEKFENSYKDIEDEKFTEVVDYIEHLKENPS
tara:strand:- start:524 stop:754 length:231 start_codon:yes stop_codon:yes gene_type:complete